MEQYKEELKIVRGNDFYLKVPVRELSYVISASGERVRVEDKINLNDIIALKVTLVSSDGIFRKAVPFAVSHEDKSCLVIKICSNTFFEGWYGIELIGINNGNRIRSYEKKVFKLVDRNGQGEISGSVYHGEASYHIDTMYYLATSVIVIDRDGVLAKENGDYAKAQGDYAKQQADRAKSIIDSLPEQQETGGDATSVNGYKFKVVFPDQYDPDKADENTIYLIVKGENIITVPEVIEVQYQLGGEGYTPVSGNGWIFNTEPTDCSNAGTYTFPISLLANNTVWSDGTLGDKVFTVVVKPLVIQCPNTITLKETGNVIPASALCQLPNGLTCSYVIKSGQSEMREAGTYVVELSLSDPNCVFAEGSKHIMVVTVEERVAEVWKFGDAFPIVFGAASVTPTRTWKFGSAFPIVFN